MDDILAAAVESKHIDTVMIIGCYMAIIAHMVWTFKSLQTLRDKLFKHETENEIHTPSSNFICRDVCEERVKHFAEKIDDVKSDLVEVKASVDKGFDSLRTLIESK